MIKKYEVLVDLDDIISCNLEQFLDMISNLCVGNELLMDIDYKVIGARDGMIELSVTGDDEEAVKWNDEYVENINESQ